MNTKNFIKNFISRYGTEIEISGERYKMLIRLCNSGESKNYLDDVEYMGLVKPAFFVTLSFDSPIVENSHFSFMNRNMTIRKITPVYFQNEVLYKTAIIY